MNLFRDDRLSRFSVATAGAYIGVHWQYSGRCLFTIIIGVTPTPLDFTSYNRQCGITGLSQEQRVLKTLFQSILTSAFHMQRPGGIPDIRTAATPLSSRDLRSARITRRPAGRTAAP
ncbi:hypothetical protein EYF80_044151 [Liparis tanakae]|uniref:Uncharacterized protein n=1 Tax=Liparis tanakae TaxID=230148 RepID=A0A4Z2FY49_9TELE|nr:hypothetical protein EYF80_044151 [Liparis tanakae]